MFTNLKKKYFGKLLNVALFHVTCKSSADNPCWFTFIRTACKYNEKETGGKMFTMGRIKQKPSIH